MHLILNASHRNLTTLHMSRLVTGALQFIGCAKIPVTWENMISGARLHGFELWFCHLLKLSYSCLSFLICKRGDSNNTFLIELHVKLLEPFLVHSKYIHTSSEQNKCLLLSKYMTETLTYKGIREPVAGTLTPYVITKAYRKNSRL